MWVIGMGGQYTATTVIKTENEFDAAWSVFVESMRDWADKADEDWGEPDDVFDRANVEAWLSEPRQKENAEKKEFAHFETTSDPEGFVWFSLRKINMHRFDNATVIMLGVRILGAVVEVRMPTQQHGETRYRYIADVHDWNGESPTGPYDPITLGVFDTAEQGIGEIISQATLYL